VNEAENKLLVKVKFFAGVSTYSEPEKSFLIDWFNQQNLPQLKTFFEERMFPYSQTPVSRPRDDHMAYASFVREELRQPFQRF
jgi:hypothetical protein